MAKETKKKEIILTRENSLILPRILTEVGMTPSVIGNRLSVAFVKRLQDAFKQIITDNRVRGGWQLGLFDTLEVREKYLKDGYIEFPLHMSELVESKTNYQVAFDFVCKAELVKVIAPDYDKNGVLQGFKAKPLYEYTMPANTEVICKMVNKKTGEVNEQTMDYAVYVTDEIHERYDVQILQYRYKKNTPPVIKIAIPKVVAEHIYNMRANKYGRILDVLSVSSNNKYFSPIYNWIAVRQKEGTVEVDYQEWKENILGLIADKDGQKPTMKGYDKFAQFNKAVLAPCLKELKDKGEEGTDCWAEVEKIYLNGRAPNPDRLRFIIHITALGKRLQEEKEVVKQMMAIEKRLREEFDQNDIQVYSISKHIPVEHRDKLLAKMNELATKKKAGKIKIEQSWQQYCNVVFSHLIADIKKEKEEHTVEINEVIPEQVKTADSRDEDKLTINEVSLSDESVQKWLEFTEDLKERVGVENFSIWFTSISCYSHHDDILCIRIPDMIVFHKFEECFIEDIKKSLYLIYGDKTELRYILKKDTE